MNKVDYFDLMFDYYYDMIHEVYRKPWNNYFRTIFGILPEDRRNMKEDYKFLESLR